MCFLNSWLFLLSANLWQITIKFSLASNGQQPKKIGVIQEQNKIIKLALSMQMKQYEPAGSQYIQLIFLTIDPLVSPYSCHTDANNGDSFAEVLSSQPFALVLGNTL